MISRLQYQMVNFVEVFCLNLDHYKSSSNEYLNAMPIHLAVDNKTSMHGLVYYILNLNFYIISLHWEFFF